MKTGNYFVRRIDIYGDRNVSFNEYKQMLLHEFTHAYDDTKGYTKDEIIQKNLSNSYGIPWEINQLIYHLWMKSEFNAWQVSYDVFNKDFNDFFEENLGFIKKAYEMPIEGQYGNDPFPTCNQIWEQIRSVITPCIPDKYQKCNLETFKKYFIRNSLYLLKKFTKKWNGKQNVYPK